MSIIGKILAGALGGLLLALLSGFFFTYAMHNGGRGASAVFLVWALAFCWAMAAKTAGKAWRYMFVTSALVCFLMPFAGILFTSNMLAQQGSSSAAATAGTVIGGGLFTGLLGFAGFFLGVVFLVIGLLCGRDPQVVIIQQMAPAHPTQK